MMRVPCVSTRHGTARVFLGWREILGELRHQHCADPRLRRGNHTHRAGHDSHERGDGVAGTDFARRLAWLIIHTHVPAFDCISRKRARLENADSPEPLIETHRSVIAQKRRI